VIQADGRVSNPEINFFNACVSALGITAAELMGLNGES
jgi:hypothetical protein